MQGPAKDRFADVKSADALATLRARAQGSRVVVIITAIIVILIVVFIIGALWRSTSDGIDNAPVIPGVGI